MMAKMWYTPEEAQAKLGCSAEELKSMVKDGLLREFRDAPNKIIYKVEEVDALAMSDLSSTGTGEIQLAPEPEDTSGSMTGIPLGDTGTALDLSGTSPLPSDTADQIGLDDTSSAEAPDDTVVTSHGVNVLDDTDEGLAPVDPHAQTQIAPDLQDLDDQVSLDGGGSGSGLLDLSREADDTSLGAELLEEIYPGSEDEGAIETQVPGGFELPTDATTGVSDMPTPAAVPVADFTTAITVEDPTSGWYGAMMILPFLILLLLSVITAAVATGVQPGLFAMLSKNIWFIVGGCGGLTLVIFLMGTFFAGRTPTPKAPKTAKPKKTKKK